MHETTGRWRLGLALALITALMWGILPIVLKLLLGQMDALSITWYRFLIAALVLGAIQARRRELPQLRELGGSGLVLVAVAITGLAGNYILYLVGLDYITPEAAQVVVQLAPALLLIGGLIFFRERFSARQWFGLALLAAGILLFFNHRLAELFGQPGRYALGILLIIAASFTWAAYALAQKQLLKDMSSENIMLLIYLASALLFLPTSDPGSALRLDFAGLALLAFASLNTLIAYGAFAEALDHWEASRVSAVLAITPLLTLLFMSLLSSLTTSLAPEPVNALSIVGAVMVVFGSVIAALAGRQDAYLTEGQP